MTKMRQIRMKFLDCTSNGKKNKDGEFCEVITLNVKTNMMSNHRAARSVVE